MRGSPKREWIRNATPWSVRGSKHPLKLKHLTKSSVPFILQVYRDVVHLRPFCKWLSSFTSASWNISWDNLLACQDWRYFVAINDDWAFCVKFKDFSTTSIFEWRTSPFHFFLCKHINIGKIKRWIIFNLWHFSMESPEKCEYFA